MFNRLSVRKLASRLYWWFQSMRRRFFGTRVDETIWKQRSRSHVQKNLGNVLLPHRAWLIDNILAHLEITSKENEGQVHTSVLEIGCGCGANLEVIARRAASLRLVGVDISPASIAVGRERFAELGLGGVTLVEGQADNLSVFADASIDVVFTDAMLLYIGPDKIQTCIEEMRRIARRAIILLEMHMDGIGSDGFYTRDGFIRDYRELCKQLSNDIKLIRMPTEKRPAGRWPKYGTLIEVTLQR
jgi:SAM-dependent methyltransferase